MKNMRFIRSAALGVITVATLSSGVMIVSASARAAANSPTVMLPAINNKFHAVNATNKVDFRTSPNWSYPSSGGFVNGNSIGLYCYEFGGAAGPYSNTLWYYAVDNANGSKGWINDHYLNTPGTAKSPQPQTGECAPSGFGTKYNSGPWFTVINAATSAQDWQYFDNSPKSTDSNGESGWYFNNDGVQLYCYEFGGPTGPYSNTLWYVAYDPASGGTYGWINDHYLNTPDTAAHPVPQTSRHC